ncbi:unnamed protein product [Durusdinium trenchii]|uniref:Uncharacterized protein n=1 Tax=Durusdinium trenchii TaxID=1381693 RepID=A0ABP0KS83_9DINO
MWRLSLLSLVAFVASETCTYNPDAFALCGKRCKRHPKGRARADCAVTCLMEEVEGLHGHCAGCFGAQVDCALANCFYICPHKPAGGGCKQCRRDRCTSCEEEEIHP